MKRSKTMSKFSHLYCGQKGFTLVESLIVVPTIGILASIETPNLVSFLPAGRAVAANTEVANGEAAAAVYYAENGSGPSDTNTDLVGCGFISGPTVYDYNFNNYARAVMPDDIAWPNASNIS